MTPEQLAWLMAKAARQSGTADAVKVYRETLDRLTNERLDDAAWEAMASPEEVSPEEYELHRLRFLDMLRRGEYPTGWPWEDLPEGAREVLMELGHTEESHRLRGAPRDPS